MRHLRDLGFGKSAIEDSMIDEIRDLIDELKAKAAARPDHIVNFKGIFIVSVVNILWSMVAGKRYKRSDLRFKQLLEDIELFFRAGDPVRANVHIPAIVLRLFPRLSRYFGLHPDMFQPLQKFIQVGCTLTKLRNLPYWSHL